MNSDVKNDTVNNSQRPDGAPQMPFANKTQNNQFSSLLGGINNHQKVMNGGINGVGSNLIGRVVQDEKQDEQQVPEQQKNEQSKIDTNNNQTLSKKNDEKDDIPFLKDMVELEKLKYLQGFNKENKEKKRIDTKQGFENDYALIEDVKNGGYLYDILNDKRFINYNAIKGREFVEKEVGNIFKRNDKSEERLQKYYDREKEIKSETDKKLSEEEERVLEDTKTIKNELKNPNGALHGYLQRLLHQIMKGIFIGNVDGKTCLKCSRGHSFFTNFAIGDLIAKLQKEIDERKFAGKVIAQDSVNEREAIIAGLNQALYSWDVIDVNAAIRAVEADTARVDEIYNGLNIFQRFWYAFMDLVFGTNYNQEYRDIVDLNNKMIEILQKIDDESDPGKKYEALRQFVACKSKLDNVRENMATFLLYPAEEHNAVLKKFAAKASDPDRKADDLVVKLFEICGGQKMSKCISHDRNDKKRKYLVDLLAKEAAIQGIGDLPISQKREIINLALDGKKGSEINQQLELIDNESETAKDDISALDASVSGGVIGSIGIGNTRKAMDERFGYNRAKNSGNNYLIRQNNIKMQIENYDDYIKHLLDDLDEAIDDCRRLIMQDASHERIQGMSMAKPVLVEYMEPLIMNGLDTFRNNIIRDVSDRFTFENDEKDADYEDVKKTIDKEIEKLSTYELSDEEKKNKEKKKTDILNLKSEKAPEISELRALKNEIQSQNKMKKDKVEEIKKYINDKIEGLKKNIVEEFAKYKNNNKEVKNDAFQAHNVVDDKHLDVYKNVENTKSRYDGTHYKDMLEILKNSRGRGGMPGMAGGAGW